MARKISGTPAYPLYWPEGQPRTPDRKRKVARFEVDFATARDHLMDELRRLGARYVVLSTNIPLRLDGLPYARYSEPEDPGVAVYFDLKDQEMVFACDKWRHVQDNTRAIGKTIEALRGIARWGSQEMMQQSFSGFKALPADGQTDWRAMLGNPVTLEEAKITYRRLAASAHPDQGGSHHEMQRLNAAWAAAQKELR